MTYTQIILQYIKTVECGEPIYLEELAQALSCQTGMSVTKAKLAVSTAMSRLIRNNNQIRKYQSGVFYKTRRSPFGNDIGIRKDKLLIHLYLNNGNGYVTGYQLLYNMGLTTQIPNHMVWVSNNVKRKVTYQSEHITVMPAKTLLSKKTIPYFSFLDALILFPKAPVDVWKPYRVLAEYMAKHKLSTKKLLNLSDKYYNDAIYKELCKTIILGGEQIAVA